MKYCSNCGVSVRGDRKRCPLCNTVLTGEGEPGGFPEIPAGAKKRRLWISVSALVSVSAAVVCILLNILEPEHGPWCLYVIFGIACGWVLLALVLSKARNAAKAIILEVYLASALFLGWDWFTGWKKWSINFFIPAACAGSVIALMILSRFLRVNVGSFTVYLLGDILLGVVQLVLLVKKIVTVPLPSAICVGVCFITLAAMIIFTGRRFWVEMEKRLHL